MGAVSYENGLDSQELRYFWLFEGRFCGKNIQTLFPTEEGLQTFNEREYNRISAKYVLRNHFRSIIFRVAVKSLALIL